MCSVRYRYSRYRYGCTELTEVSGTGIDVVPSLAKRPVPVLILYRNYPSVRYRYWCTELTEVSGTGTDVVPNLTKCPVPVLISYRTYRSVCYRYSCRTELTEVSSTGSTGGIFRRYVSVRTVPNTPFCRLCKRYPLDYQLKKKWR